MDRTIDLWAYADGANPDRPLTFALGLSTACVVRKDTSSHPERMKSRLRRVVAVARLAEPYCVWLRKVTNKRLSLTNRGHESYALSEAGVRPRLQVRRNAFSRPQTAG